MTRYGTANNYATRYTGPSSYHPYTSRVSYGVSAPQSNWMSSPRGYSFVPSQTQTPPAGPRWSPPPIPQSQVPQGEPKNQAPFTTPVGGNSGPYMGPTTDTRFHPPGSTTALPPWDPNTDPVIAMVRGQADQMVALAKAQMLAAQKRDLVGFGSRELAQSILGKKDALLGTISDSPDQSFSFLANLKRQYGEPIGQASHWTNSTRLGLVPQAEENLNQDNLWFSSTHGDTLNNLFTQQGMEKDAEQRRVQGQLSSYSDAYANAVLQAKMLLMNAIIQRQQALGLPA